MISEVAVQQHGFSRKDLKRLVWKKKIKRWNHAGGFAYWTRQSETPLSNKGLLRALAYEIHCSASHRRMIDSPTLEEFFPQLFRNGLAPGCYIEHSDTHTRLGLLRVDTHNSAPNRMVKKTTDLINQFKRKAGYHTLLQNKQFEICWAVFTKAKQNRLNQKLQAVESRGVNLKTISLPLLIGVAAPIN